MSNFHYQNFETCGISQDQKSEKKEIDWLGIFLAVLFVSFCGFLIAFARCFSGEIFFDTFSQSIFYIIVTLAGIGSVLQFSGANVRSAIMLLLGARLAMMSKIEIDHVLNLLKGILP